MPGPVFIDGDRIDLRTVEEEDIEFLKHGINHPEVRRYIPVFRTPYNHERYEDIFGDIDSSENGASLLICTDSEPVGSIQLYPIDDSRGWANLGYWIIPEKWGNDYATEAAALVLEYGFSELRLHRVSADPVTSNTASRQVLEQLGFTHEGTKRETAFVGGEYVDMEQYGLLESEWRKQSEESS